MKLALVLFKYDIAIDDPCCYPLGFMYISSVLKNAGHEVSVFNANIDVYPPYDLTGFDAVLMTGFESFFPQIKQLAAKCKLQGVKTILGGALATFKPNLMAEIVDIVVVGEGERSVLTALAATRGVIQDLGKSDLTLLPRPDYEGFGVGEYHKRHDGRYMGVLTSRGCPYKCTFCAHTCRFQMRPLDQVFAEIDHYKAKYQITNISFNDNTLNLNKPRFLDICSGMAARGLKWGCAIRVDVWDDEMAAAAKRSRCEYLVVGVESFDQKRLDSLNKKITVGQITRCLDSIIKHDLMYHANVLFGFPGECFDTIMTALRVMPRYDRVFPALVQPFIGTGCTTRSITPEQKDYLHKMFTGYAARNGMTVLPEAGHV